MPSLSCRPETPLNFMALLPENEKEHLLRIGRIRHFVKNELVFKTGQDDQYVYVLVQGRIKLYGSSAEGRDLLLSFTLSGDVLGMTECAQESQQVYACAAEQCEVLCIAHDQFMEWLMHRPQLAIQVINILSSRLREIGHRLLSLANGSIQIGIAQVLIRLGINYGRQVGAQKHIAIPLTEQDIADMLGASRQGVSSCLAKLKRRGIIDSIKHVLIIKDEPQLNQIAQATKGRLVIARTVNRRVWQHA